MRWPLGWSPADPVTATIRALHVSSAAPGRPPEPVTYTESPTACTIHVYEEDTREAVDLSFFRHAVIQMFMSAPIYCRRARWLAETKHMRTMSLAHDLEGLRVDIARPLDIEPWFHGYVHYTPIAVLRSPDAVMLLDAYDGTPLSIRYALDDAGNGAYLVTVMHKVESILYHTYRRADAVAAKLRELAGTEVDPGTIADAARRLLATSDDYTVYNLAWHIARRAGVDYTATAAAILTVSYTDAMSGDVLIDTVGAAAEARKRAETLERIEGCDILGTWAETLLPARDSARLRQVCRGE